MMRPQILSIVAAVAVLAGAGPAFADYPEQPITYIVPYAPGSSSDVSTRTWQPYMEKCLGGATMIVENHPGAGGLVGFTKLANSKPDGYTFGNVTVPNVITAGFTQELSYKDDSFQLIGTMIGNSSTLSVRKDSEINTLDDFLKFAKGSATPVNIGVGGVGGDDHIAAVQMMAASGISATVIPFGESALTRAALLGNHVQVVVSSDAETARFRDEMKPLAVASPARAPLLEDVPTFKEMGLDFVGGSAHILAAPKGVPDEIVSKWKSCLEEMAVNPDVKAEITKRALPFNHMNADQVQKYFVDSRQKLTDLWKASPWIK
jgi:tripartite-type tricarboxylate transporter receptor subunit TctC